MLINYGCNSGEEYFKKFFFIPYLDFLIFSLSQRFSNENKIMCSINLLHSLKLKNIFSINSKTRLNPLMKISKMKIELCNSLFGINI